MTIRTRVFAPVLALLALSIAGPAWSDFELNMPVGVTTTSREVYELHMLILWVCVVIGAGVYGAMIAAIVKFRKSKGAVPAKFTHNATIEVIWTVIPAVILVAMAVPAAETLIRMEDTRESELTIKITGYQWRWHYDYIDEGVGFFSTLDRESNAARRARLRRRPDHRRELLARRSTTRSSCPSTRRCGCSSRRPTCCTRGGCPRSGVKKDAVPGYINETWFTADTEGTYRGQCAELCGMDHGFMPIVVRVASQEDYDAWLSQQRARVSALTPQ